jgi:hypothetical protein
VKHDPALNEPVIGPDGKVETFKGWVDPSFKPEPSASPFPDCWSGTAGGGTPAPQATLPPNATIDKLTAQNIAYSTLTLAAPANQPFGIDFSQMDPGVGGHDADILKEDGTKLVDNPVLTDVGETTYVIPALPAGTYKYQCSVHPSVPNMNGTLTVK